MSEQAPVVALVHGAFAESVSWAGVIERLAERSVEAIAIGNPLRGLPNDAAYVNDVIAGIGRPVVLVGHSYGGMVVTQASSSNDAVTALVYVNAFAPEHGEGAFALSTKFPGGTLGAALVNYPLSTGGEELGIRRDLFHQQFCADVPAETAAVMAATQRPATATALTEALPAETPGWRIHPSWFVFGDRDRIIPADLHRFMALRAEAKGIREVAGASHAVMVSQPQAVTDTILEALGQPTS
jgi:pimeloyl-ACP methyl ester carboxylesterase